MGAATDPYSTKHSGACSSGYISAESGTMNDLSACKTACTVSATCQFIAFCPSGTTGCTGGHHNKCALYSSCASATSHQGYTTYSKSQVCALTQNAAISGHNIEHLTSQTVQSCEAACNRRSWCKSFDWYKNSNECDLSDKCAADVGGLKRDYGGNPYDHYSCQCSQETRRWAIDSW